MTCLELAYWQSATRFQEMGGSRLDPQDVKRKLLDRLKRDLPHLVGQRFTDAIEACLRFKELTQGMDEFSVHQEYKNKVVSRLEEAAMYT